MRKKELVMAEILVPFLFLLFFPCGSFAENRDISLRFWGQISPFISGEAGSGLGAPDYSDAFDYFQPKSTMSSADLALFGVLDEGGTRRADCKVVPRGTLFHGAPISCSPVRVHHIARLINGWHPSSCSVHRIGGKWHLPLGDASVLPQAGLLQMAITIIL
jgi:hypothetical protein